MDCSVRVECRFLSREADLFELIHREGKELFELRKRACDQKTPQLANERLMALLLAVLDFLFGCHHVHLSRVFTIKGETYKVCFDCGAKFAYSLATMSIERRLPLTPVLTQFRIA